MSAMMHCLIATLHACWHTSVRSAPLIPSQILAMSCKFTSGWIGDFFRQALRMLYLLASSGIGIYTSWSNLPGLIRASSKISGLLVAPTMNTLAFFPTPSISVKSWLMTRSPAPPPSPPEPPPLWTPMESNSSKNKTQGLLCLALSNISLTLASDSPNHMVNNSGPLMDMKFALHSLAMAFARSVLPHPGGP